jgi:hypothetical protein
MMNARFTLPVRVPAFAEFPSGQTPAARHLIAPRFSVRGQPAFLRASGATDQEIRRNSVNLYRLLEPRVKFLRLGRRNSLTSIRLTSAFG